MNNDFVAQLQERLLLLRLLETLYLDDLNAYDLWLELFGEKGKEGDINE